MIGKYDSDFGVPKKLSDAMKDNVVSIIEKGKAQIVYEDSLDAATGRIRHFKSIKKPFKTLNGEDNILVIAHDVTDLIGKEQALKKSEEKLNDILELVGEGIWQWDMVTNTVTHNHQWCKLLGLSDDLLEHHLDFFASKIVPEHKDMVFERLQNALKNNTEFTSQHKLLKDDGSAFWVEDRGKIVQKDEKNNPTMIVGAIRDITAEKELEEYSKNLNEALRNLRQKEHELNDYLKSASDFVWEVNTNGLFTKVSNGIIDILGYTDEEILKMTPFDIMEEDEAIRVKSIFDELLKDEKPIKELENWVVAKDGTKHCMMTNGIPFYDEDGLFMGYRGTDRDITRLKEQEETIVKQEKRALMGDMLENIAHQWRQPLSVITTSATGIQVQKELNTLNDQKLDDSINSIVNSAFHLSNTIDDFRSFYKNEAVATEFNLCKAIDKSLMLMSSKFKNREIEVIKKLEDINIVGFKNEMIQVFMNILSNAQDELQNINNQKRIIIIETKHTQDHIEISFQDNAGGVPNDIIDNIFIQNFTTKADQDGTGIGLFMSKNIIEKLNGTLEVENKEFKIDDNLYIGAKFTVTLHIN